MPLATSLFPHPPYAEDQPLYHTILASHVVYRGFQAGSIFGLATGVALSVYGGKGSKSMVTRSTSIVKSVGTGSIVGGAALAVILPLYMMGETEIQWKDRSWRLLENQTQMAVDDWSGIGLLLGLGSLAVRGSSNSVALGWREVVGRAGIGGLAGIGGAMIWNNVFQSKESSSETSL